MNNYWWILVWVLAAMAAAAFVGKRMDKGERIDQGFAFCFWNISYRRRFFRTMYMAPVAAIATALVHVTYRDSAFTCAVGFLLAAACAVQAWYYYKKWKSEEV